MSSITFIFILAFLDTFCQLINYICNTKDIKYKNKKHKKTSHKGSLFLQILILFCCTDI